MKNFKPNQKVVFRDMGGSHSCYMIVPKENEVVTIKESSEVHINGWCLYEYQFSIDGRIQAFHERHLFPIEEVFSEQSKEDIERIESEIEQEQLITVTP